MNGVVGSAVCTGPSCLNATATLVGVVDDLHQSGVGLPEDDVIHTIDGSLTLDLTLRGSGPFGLNGFVPQFTPEGSGVTVGSRDGRQRRRHVLRSRQEEVVPFAAKANVRLGRRTKALYTPPVEVCIVIPDTVTIPLDQLRILHREGDEHDGHVHDHVVDVDHVRHHNDDVHDLDQHRLDDPAAGVHPRAHLRVDPLPPGGRRIPDELRAVLADAVSPIQSDMQMLRGSL